MKPPIEGPTVGATSIGMAVIAMASTSSFLLVRLSMISRPIGVSSDAAAPWNARARMNSQKFGASAQHSEKAAKPTVAAMNTRLAPKRSAAQPLTGSTATSMVR